MKNLDKDLEAIKTGIDENNRIIYFGGDLNSIDTTNGDLFVPVTQYTVEYVVRALQSMANRSSKPITLYLQSNGGDAYATLYLVDVIQSLPAPVHCIAGGAVCSAATWIMAACDYRLAYPNTTFLIHAGSTGIQDDLVSSEIYMDEQKRLQKLLEQIYARNSRMGAEFWSEVCKRDLFLTAEEALWLGLIDEIIQPLKRGAWRSKRIANLNKKINQKQFKQIISQLLKRIKIEYRGDIRIEIPVELFAKMDNDNESSTSTNKEE